MKSIVPQEVLLKVRHENRLDWIISSVPLLPVGWVWWSLTAPKTQSEEEGSCSISTHDHRYSVLLTVLSPSRAWSGLYSSLLGGSTSLLEILYVTLPVLAWQNPDSKQIAPPLPANGPSRVPR
jgi:hypothetical protein